MVFKASNIIYLALVGYNLSKKRVSFPNSVKMTQKIPILGVGSLMFNKMSRKKLLFQVEYKQLDLDMQWL